MRKIIPYCPRPWAPAFYVLRFTSYQSRITLPRQTFRITHHASRITRTFLILACGLSALAADLDPSKLPPPAQVTVDFEKDIKPIFDKSCFRCHGPERPRSRFRLDNRESALKGGDNGVDIVPGSSAKSPLVYYVARVADDIEMPPEGKGEPLTLAQVGLLRAWIDQGAQWGATNAAATFSFSASPELRFVTVEGDKHKFREVEGTKEGFGGGVEQFSMEEKIGPDKTFSAEGRVLVPDDDVRLKLELRKTDVGFVRGGFEQWRKYYDDTGGYYRPFSPPAFDLNRDLHLDVGRAWVDFGLTLPHWPQIVLGYEYQFKEGDKSTLEWGNVGGATSGKNIYPAAESIHEHTHVARLDVTHDVLGFHLEDNARVELYESRTRHDDAASFSTGPTPETTVRSSCEASHVQGMNAFRLERYLTDWWFVSGGYLYSKLEGDASLDQITINAFGAPAVGTFWSADTTTLKTESHVVSLANLILPVTWLSLSAGVQSEWTRQEGFGNVNLDQGDPNLPGSFFLYPAVVQSDLDKQETSENFSLRFTRIPWTVLFAEGRFDQESIGQFEQDSPQSGVTPDTSTTFLRNTDYTNDRREIRGGFSTSPWKWATLSAHYKRRDSDSDYDNHKIALDPAGYSAFIRARRLGTDEVEAKLALHPLSWMRTTLTYQLVATDYSTTTDPVPGATLPSALQAGNYDAHVYGINTTLTPWNRLSLSGAFTYSDSRILTLQTIDPSVAPYKGDIYAVTASATYLLNDATELRAAYSFSRSDYGQDNIVGGLPLGLNYTRHALTLAVTRRVTDYLSTKFGYGFYQYREPSTGGINNYTAHGVFATLMLKWPGNSQAK
jgi:Planctomycete cytochrome C